MTLGLRLCHELIRALVVGRRITQKAQELVFSLSHHSRHSTHKPIVQLLVHSGSLFPTHLLHFHLKLVHLHCHSLSVVSWGFFWFLNARNHYFHKLGATNIMMAFTSLY